MIEIFKFCVCGLIKFYDCVLVLECVELDVDVGFFCIIVGVFGCGKFIFLCMLFL